MRLLLLCNTQPLYPVACLNGLVAFVLKEREYGFPTEGSIVNNEDFPHIGVPPRPEPPVSTGKR